MSTTTLPSTKIDSLLKLFNKSLLKQQKYRVVTGLLGATDGLRCLDVGSDNGVISYLLRQRGGSWASVDLDAHTVEAIRGVVGSDVHQTDGQTLPFESAGFDRVVILDILEHLHTDQAFMNEVARILKANGEVIINVPHAKHSLLRRLRLMIGQTDAIHGHVRHGYTLESLRALLGNRFEVVEHFTYSKFFSEFIDTLIRQAVAVLKGRKKDHGQKGQIVTGDDLSSNKSMFKFYSAIYPVVWLFAKLDELLFFRSGYMLIVKARRVPGEAL